MCLFMLTACGNNNSANQNSPDTSTTPGQSSPDTSTTPGQSPSAGAETKYKEHLDIIVQGAAPTIINPFTPAATATGNCWVFILAFDRLVERDHATGEFYPALASSWKTDDYKTYTFNLRDDVFFHNGDKFTADDVIKTIELSREVGAGSGGYSTWAAIDSYKAVDDYTVEFVLNNVDVDFIFGLSMPYAIILNTSAIEKDFDSGMMIGTGAFKVDDFESGLTATLVRNHDYFDTTKNIVTEAITLRYVADDNVRTIRMQNGESDICLLTPAIDFHIFEDDPDHYGTYLSAVNSINGYGFNFNDPLMKDFNLRMAIMYATDRESIIQLADMKALTTNDGTVWGLEMEFRNTDIPVIPFDLAEAKRYLELSSYNGEVIEITAGMVQTIKQAAILQQQLAAIGINTTINETDQTGLFAYALPADSPAQIIFHNLAFSLSAASARNAFYPGGSTNYMNYNNPEVNKLIEAGSSITDKAEREANYKKIQEIVAKDAPFYNFAYSYLTISYQNGVGGLLPLPSTNTQYDLREVYRIID